MNSLYMLLHRILLMFPLALLVQGCHSQNSRDPQTRPQNAFEIIEAEHYDREFGVDLGAEGEVVTNISHGDWLLYRQLDFEEGAKSVAMRLATVNQGGSLEMRLGAVDGPLIGTLEPSTTGSWTTFSVQAVSVESHGGKHDLYLVGRGGTRVGDLDWFQFSTAPTDSEVTDTESDDTADETDTVDDTGTSSSTESEETDSGAQSSAVSVKGRQLLVNGEPFHIQGVCWNPVKKGFAQDTGLDYRGFAPRDIPLMKAAGINAVRTYSLVDDRDVLDQLYEAGIFIINTIYGYGGADVDTEVNRAAAVKDHPAILMWSVGNEWNYNHLYDNSLDFAAALKRVGEVATAMKSRDDGHPIATVYGGVPDKYTIDRLPAVDIWGINYYNGLSFDNIFPLWQSRSSKPMFLAEYGADAYNTKEGFVDLASQALAVKMLTELILAASSRNNPANVCLGGTVFEWCDEWWKDFTDGNGGPAVHDTGGAAPGGGPYPDGVFNEEYWGIVDIDRRPRPAYEALGKLYL